MKRFFMFLGIGVLLFIVGFVLNRFFGIEIEYAGILYLISCFFVGFGCGVLFKKRK